MDEEVIQVLRVSRKFAELAAIKRPSRLQKLRTIGLPRVMPAVTASASRRIASAAARCSFAGGGQYLGQVGGQGTAACFREDTEDMNRERAETYLRQLAEVELRRARTLPAASIPGRRNTARLALVAQALVAVGAVDVGTASEIQAGLELAVAVRQPGQVNQASPSQRGLSPHARMRLARLMHSPPPRTATVALPVSGLRAGHTRPAPQRASWNSTCANLRQPGPPDTGGCLIPHSSLTAKHQRTAHQSNFGHVRIAEA